MIELPTGYYLANFQILLAFVEDHYSDILLPNEAAYAKRFAALDQDAARLYVRLISRKGPHFLKAKLHYPEIHDLAAACKTLQAQGLLDHNPAIAASELTALLTRADLEALIQTLTPTPPAQLKRLAKPALLELLHTIEDSRLCAAFYSQHDVVTPLGQEILQIFRLLFFGNLSQDLTEFVLLDLGVLRYEDYALEREHRLFQSRDILDHHLLLLHLRELCWQASQLADGETLAQICAALPEPLNQRSLQRRAGTILNEAARCFERQGDFDLALATYARTNRPPSRERRARIHEKRGELAQAQSLCQEMLEQPYEEQELEFAGHFINKVLKKLGRPQRAIHKVDPPVETLTLPRLPEQRVEAAVLVHLAQQGCPGFYAENHFWSNLFGLLFWDIVFQPVPGAFFNRYQRGPKDLFSADFREARSASVAKRLARIAAGDNLPELVQTTYLAKQGIANPFINWRQLDKAQIDMALARVPAPHLAAICDRLTRNPGEFRSGLPDLLCFPDVGYLLVEVKGPGDQLQNNQRRWLHYFSEHGIAYRIARVVWDCP